MLSGLYWYKDPDSQSVRLVRGLRWLLVRRDYKDHNNWLRTERYRQLSGQALVIWHED